MRTILKHRKALSPVVAAIILIAVTVAVSIAVAAWMGALTISFMGSTEELKIIDVYYDNMANTTSIEVRNVGTGAVTISDIRIDGTTYKNFKAGGELIDDDMLPYELPDDLDKGDSRTFIIAFNSWAFKSGVSYEFTILTSRGNPFPYPKTCPS